MKKTQPSHSFPVDYRKIFDVDFKKLASLLTPVDFRKLNFMQFVWSMIAPLTELKRDFDKYRKKSLYRITHNGQVILLTKVLNDSFDPEERRIYLADSFSRDPLYIYTKNEARPVYLGEKYIYKKTEFGGIDVDFYAIFPLSMKPAQEADITDFENLIKGQINTYKQPEKRYKILWID